jgi:tRNA A-37 threonylcarbamoyl transferase component Bud32
MLSDVVVTPQIETNVVDAFKKLHQHRVYHGDIRPANIIVRNDQSVVIIDFERSVLNASRRILSEERYQVRHMLQAKKQIGWRNPCIQ